VKNPRKHYMLLKAMKEFNLSFIDISFEDLNKLPRSVKILLVDDPSIKEKLNSSFKIILVNEDPPEKLIFKIQSLLHGKEFFNYLIIGIDPGFTYGVMVLGDGFPIISKTFNEVDDLISFIKDILTFCPSKERIIKIGRGGGKYLEILLKKLKKNFLNFPLKSNIELVDEASLTSISARNFAFNVDVEAAYNIALSKGEKIKWGSKI